MRTWLDETAPWWFGRYSTEELRRKVDANRLALLLGTKLSPGVNPGVHPSGTLPSAPETSVEKGTKDA